MVYGTVRKDPLSPGPCVWFPSWVACGYLVVSRSPLDKRTLGWGATLPALLIRNIIGFRESSNPRSSQFLLAPSIPARLAKPGQTYGISNLKFRNVRTNVSYHVLDENHLEIETAWRSEYSLKLEVKDNEGKVVASTQSHRGELSLTFKGKNGAVFLVALTNLAGS